jgi:hypothetical protein
MRRAKWGAMNPYVVDWQARVNNLTMSVDSWNGLIDHFTSKLWRSSYNP